MLPSSLFPTAYNRQTVHPGGVQGCVMAAPPAPESTKAFGMHGPNCTCVRTGRLLTATGLLQT